MKEVIIGNDAYGYDIEQFYKKNIKMTTTVWEKDGAFIPVDIKEQLCPTEENVKVKPLINVIKEAAVVQPIIKDTTKRYNEILQMNKNQQIILLQNLGIKDLKKFKTCTEKVRIDKIIELENE